MKISDVEKLTGLTAKAIRLYEEKGLISVSRKDNSYRDYTQEDINRLQQIKLLRDLGVSLSEISLCFHNVISLQEVLYNRKKALETEHAANKENYDTCISLLEKIKEQDSIQDSEVIVVSSCKALLGLDIGTTTISAVVMDAEKDVILETYVIANDSRLPSDSTFQEYDVQWILGKVERMLHYLVRAYPQITSIGVTGQMHGVLYVDAQGQAVSPFYNWQDGRGDKNYCQEIFQKTGYTVFSGYGFATLYYNQRNQLEPPQAVSFCTIMDYVVMQLTGNRTPLMHPTNAASLGLYLLEQNAFDREAVGALGLSHFSLPEIAMEPALAGTYQGIPVGVAIGDNQASFYGSVKHEENTALVNFGTGSQISAVIDHVEIVDVDAQLEIRPYLFGKYLICGSALCGGKAYAILETFFSAYVGNGEQQYETMNRLAQKAYEQKSALHVKTQFSGTRKDPELKGSILDITENNFTPEQLILGVLQGMAEELKQYFDAMQLDHVTQLAASGNAVQKNPVLPLVLQDLFGLPVTLTENKEEAAIGAALYTRRVCYELE